ncbi:hypothetical protein ABK040_010797 [Willaertia magna]
MNILNSPSKNLTPTKKDQARNITTPLSASSSTTSSITPHSQSSSTGTPTNNFSLVGNTGMMSPISNGSSSINEDVNGMHIRNMMKDIDDEDNTIEKDEVIIRTPLKNLNQRETLKQHWQSTNNRQSTIPPIETKSPMTSPASSTGMQINKEKKLYEDKIIQLTNELNQARNEIKILKKDLAEKDQLINRLSSMNQNTLIYKTIGNNNDNTSPTGSTNSSNERPLSPTSSSWSASVGIPENNFNSLFGENSFPNKSPNLQQFRNNRSNSVSGISTQFNLNNQQNQIRLDILATPLRNNHQYNDSLENNNYESYYDPLAFASPHRTSYVPIESPLLSSTKRSTPSYHNSGNRMFLGNIGTPTTPTIFYNNNNNTITTPTSASTTSTLSSVGSFNDTITPIKQSPSLGIASNLKTNSNDIVYLLSGGGVGSIKVYDLTREEYQNNQDVTLQHSKRGYDKNTLTDYYLSLKGHSRFVSALHSHQGKICSGSGDNSIRIWNFNTGECEHTLAGCEGKVGALCSIYGLLISGSKDGNSHRIRAWDIEKVNCVKNIPAHSDWINVLCANENTLFSGSGDKKVKVWSGPNFENTLTLENPSFVLSLVYDPIYNTLVAGTYDGYIRVWDLRSSKLVKQIKAHSNGVLSLCYHNGLLCSGSKDQTISIYDPKNWNRQAQLLGHSDAVKVLQSYKDQWLCSGSYDRTVKLWDLSNPTNSFYTIATGFKNYTLTCHTVHTG